MDSVTLKSPYFFKKIYNSKLKLLYQSYYKLKLKYCYKNNKLSFFKPIKKENKSFNEKNNFKINIYLFHSCGLRKKNICQKFIIKHGLKEE